LRRSDDETPRADDPAASHRLTAHTTRRHGWASNAQRHASTSQTPPGSRDRKGRAPLHWSGLL
jgi:hypothetical protein